MKIMKIILILFGAVGFSLLLVFINKKELDPMLTGIGSDEANSVSRSSFNSEVIINSESKLYNDLTNTSVNKDNLQIDGIYLKAFLAAYKSFESDKDIPVEKRVLENYNINFSSDKENILVSFFVKRKPSAQDIPDEPSPLGRDVTYLVSKTSYKVVNRILYK